ncbi:putative mitochondrial protein (mitochondrion) [Arabidopsis thaliana]|uniref:Uncharacterized mitochondrial protein AtMg01370 n=3 Tax=Arabidopsis TaxID=3701 RepID=M1370_ARATH|nr:RecName: Full=Uncharacterized mitochondrial protein AtMg01370; AltName: Full=ORF111d [Arabidopsis thaliana]KAG7529256.1 hypothetical protein ISN45_Un97g000390 [Arabidopsis thaliana x Arabidopsis arenosa]KAG7529338.1 hypothetical protein ISN44_Un143g000250 [Arabidopsis suecica]CAA69786.1 unnamed protein product [Arabidopsis thaliana]
MKISYFIRRGKKTSRRSHFIKMKKNIITTQLFKPDNAFIFFSGIHGSVNRATYKYKISKTFGRFLAHISCLICILSKRIFVLSFSVIGSFCHPSIVHFDCLLFFLDTTPCL